MTGPLARVSLKSQVSSLKGPKPLPPGVGDLNLET